MSYDQTGAYQNAPSGLRRLSFVLICAGTALEIGALAGRPGRLWTWLGLLAAIAMQAIGLMGLIVLRLAETPEGDLCRVLE